MVFAILLLSAFGSVMGLAQEEVPTDSAGFTGSVSCRDCHERFYERWATSHHGLAMQPYTDEFARTNLTVPSEEIDEIVWATGY